MIDERLLDCDGEMEITENFNRILSIIDSVSGAVTCTVTFNSDGGGAVTAQTVPFGGTAEEPSPPTKEGNTFDGWYLDDAVYDFDAPVITNITLVAHWIVV